MTNNYIAIEGVIGAGKTTLSRLLQRHFQATILLEVFEENPFLAKFYQERERFAFQTQLFFLLSRSPHEAHQETLTKHRASPKGELADLLVACILKIANYTGIDLEQTYVEKIGQQWWLSHCVIIQLHGSVLW